MGSSTSSSGSRNMTDSVSSIRNMSSIENSHIINKTRTPNTNHIRPTSTPLQGPVGALPKHNSFDSITSSDGAQFSAISGSNSDTSNNISPQNVFPK